MRDYLARIIEQQAQAAARMREIIEAADAESRDLTAEDQESLARFDADFDRLSTQRSLIERAHERSDAADAVRAAVSVAVAQSAAAEGERAPSTDAAIMNAYLRRFRSGDRSETSFVSERSIPVGADEQRALAEAIGTTVPQTFADFVTVYERTINPVYAVSRVLSTRTGDQIVLPRLTADPTAGGSVTAEAGGITEGDATISSIVLNAYKIAHTQLWSAELDTDNVVGIDQLLADAVGRAIGLGWGTFFTTGSDSGQPNGFITAGTNGGTALGTASGSATDTFFSPADLVDLYFSIANPYRMNGTWMFSTTAMQKARKFRDSNKQFVWQPSLQAGVPELFMGRPAYENPAMAAVASATKSVAFGDFSRYVIREVPVRVDLSRDYKFNTDQVALRYITRRDGDLVDTAAIAYLVSANT